MDTCIDLAFLRGKGIASVSESAVYPDLAIWDSTATQTPANTVHFISLQNCSPRLESEGLALAAGGHGLAVRPFALESGADLVGRLVGRAREVSAWSFHCSDGPLRNMFGTEGHAQWPRD